jgi:hypothetical protein
MKDFNAAAVLDQHSDSAAGLLKGYFSNRETRPAANRRLRAAVQSSLETIIGRFMIVG